jgi:hypothetical protein
MFAKATQMKGFSTLLTYNRCLSSVCSFMPFKESGNSKGVSTILTLKWHFSICLILIWLVSTLSSEGQTQGWMPDNFFTQFSFGPTPVGVLLLILWSVFSTLNIFFMFTESPYHLTSRNNKKHITKLFFQIPTRWSNGFMAWKNFWTCKMVPWQILSNQWYCYRDLKNLSQPFANTAYIFTFKLIWGWCVAQVIEWLPSKHEALSSDPVPLPRPPKKKKKTTKLIWVLCVEKFGTKVILILKYLCNHKKTSWRL